MGAGASYCVTLAACASLARLALALALVLAVASLLGRAFALRCSLYYSSLSVPVNQH